jgi:hypothetical protein
MPGALKSYDPSLADWRTFEPVNPLVRVERLIVPLTFQTALITRGL